MALRDQPYLPLYIQDFLTDEKLIECSAQATGVYIRLMCIMHKSETYGTILLKQTDKQNTEQTGKQISNFASKLVKQMPYSQQVIEAGLDELLTHDVLQIDGDFLIQDRMFRDGQLSKTRSETGKLGGKKTAKAKRQANIKPKRQPKPQANPEYEYESVNDTELLNNKGIPDIQTFKNYIRENYHGSFSEIEQSAELKYKSWVENDWKTGNDQPIKNWKTTILNTIPHLKIIKNDGNSETRDKIGRTAVSEIKRFMDEPIIEAFPKHSTEQQGG